MAGVDADQPDENQGHAREWPSTPYSDEARGLKPSPENACCIALMGDCTVACSYLPPANRPENHLRVRLRRDFMEQPFVVRNFGFDGGAAEDWLAPGRLEERLQTCPLLDVAFVRFGINDRKRNGIAGCIRNLTALCDGLKQRYTDIQIFIETGIWVDYPEHYLWDRNARLGPLYEALRAFANEAGYPVVDIYANMRRETESGNWDLRVRGLPAPEHIVVDDSLDAFYGSDPAFFTNIHPNSRCLGLIAQWEAEALPIIYAANSLRSWIRSSGRREILTPALCPPTPEIMG